MKISTICFWLLATSTLVFGQDPNFSQFYASKVYLNPAYAGLDPGVAAEVSYRDQWFGVPDGSISTFKDSYSTYVANLNLQIPCIWQLENLNMGLGFSALYDEAGNNPLSTLGFGIAHSYEVKFFGDGRYARNVNRKGRRKYSRLDLRIGYQASFLQKRLSGDWFLYSSSLHPVDGIIDGPVGLTFNSPWFANINAGLMIRGAFSFEKGKEYLYTLGVSINNVNEPNESLYDGAGNFSLYRRYTIHGGMTIPLRRYIGRKNGVAISPHFRYDYQANLNLDLFTFGAYTLSKGYYMGVFFQGNTRHYTPPTPADPLSGNFLTKNTSTLIFAIGCDLKTVFDLNRSIQARGYGMVVGFSYDIGLSGLTQQNTLGVFEIQLTMNFGDQYGSRCDGRPGKFELYDGSCPVRF